MNEVLARNYLAKHAFDLSNRKAACKAAREARAEDDIKIISNRYQTILYCTTPNYTLTANDPTQRINPRGSTPGVYSDAHSWGILLGFIIQRASQRIEFWGNIFSLGSKSSLDPCANRAAIVEEIREPVRKIT